MKPPKQASLTCPGASTTQDCALQINLSILSNLRLKDKRQRQDSRKVGQEVFKVLQNEINYERKGNVNQPNALNMNL